MSNPLASRHIAPLYTLLQTWATFMPKGCASLTYSHTKGVLLHSKDFDNELKDGARDFCSTLGTPQELAQVRAYITRTAQSVASSKQVSSICNNGALDAASNDEDTLCALDMLALLAWRLKGWRKGPFSFLSPTQAFYIDSEWQSQRKWNLLAPIAHLQGAHIADIGCNNGFYMLAMFAQALEQSLHIADMSPSPRAHITPSYHAYNPSSDASSSPLLTPFDAYTPPCHIVGFDPSGLYYCQFFLLNHLLNLPITYELLGVSDLPSYTKQRRKKFDVIFCLGVLYHRSDVFACLKSIAQSLETGGQAFIDTLLFDVRDYLPSTFSHTQEASILEELELVLSVKGSYARMKNVYLLPSLSALEGWCARAGLCDMEVLDIVQTTLQEQRKSEWIDSLSLESFLHPNDPQKTIEGYAAPKRAYIRVRKSHG